MNATLTRNGVPVSKRNESSTAGTPFEKNYLHSENEYPPYISDFINFDIDSLELSNNHIDGDDVHVQYFDKQTSQLTGEIVYRKKKIKWVWIEERRGGYIVKREERYSQSGKLDNRRLLVSIQRRYNRELVNFCYEKYKNDFLDLFATSISDHDISCKKADFVRYLFGNGKIVSKETFSGKDLRFKRLSSIVPIPVIHCAKGELVSRYTALSNGAIQVERDFEKPDKPYVIIENRSDSWDYICRWRSTITPLPIDNPLDDLYCNIRSQYDYFIHSLETT